MANPFVGEIRCFGFNFAPLGWALCNGQLLSISQNTALFSLLGTNFGGNGTSTFGLPNLQGNVPMHWGTSPGGFNSVIGEVQGSSTVTLLSSQIPIHNHPIVSQVVAPGGAAEHAATPSSGASIGPSNPDGLYNTSPTINATLSPSTIGATGGSQPHDNMQPYLTLNFCIALQGVFPARN
jgi:microcystin-dependent protein